MIVISKNCIVGRCSFLTGEVAAFDQSLRCTRKQARSAGGTARLGGIPEPAACRLRAPRAADMNGDDDLLPAIGVMASAFFADLA